MFGSYGFSANELTSRKSHAKPSIVGLRVSRVREVLVSASRRYRPELSQGVLLKSQRELASSLASTRDSFYFTLVSPVAQP